MSIPIILIALASRVDFKEFFVLMQLSRVDTSGIILKYIILSIVVKMDTKSFLVPVENSRVGSRGIF